MTNQIRLKDLSKTFITGNREVRAVDKVNLDIAAGEFICLLGPSGCGKTTILRMFAGFEIPSHGEILINGKNVAHLSPDKRNAGMVFQSYALFPHLNVFDNIAYALKIRKLEKGAIRHKVHEALGMMGMQGFAERQPSQLSGGQQQRVAVARALVMEPTVLLFDEPLSNLDAKLRIDMRNEIRRIQQELGITSIYVTHDQSEAMAIADRIVVMKDGVVRQVASPQQVYQKPVDPFVANFIGRANIMKARLTSHQEGLAQVSFHGKTLSLPLIKGRSYSPGMELLLMARPETIALGGDFKAGVTRSIFMGETHEYSLDFEGEGLEVVVSNPELHPTLKVGESLDFSFHLDGMHILN